MSGRLLGRLGAGIAAGAAGTTALNAVTYLDMALRGRPASSVPERGVDALAERAGLTVPGEGEAREARRTGLGALLGLLTGVGIGAVYGLARPLAPGIPWPAAGIAAGLGAMAATDAGSARLGTTDPRDWSAADWAADIVPHVAYGLGTALAYEGLAPR